MLTTLPFAGFYCSKWSNELDDVENNFIENEAENDNTLDNGVDWDKYREMCDERRKEIEEERAEEDALADADPDKRLYQDKPLDLVQYVTDFCRMNNLKE